MRVERRRGIFLLLPLLLLLLFALNKIPHVLINLLYLTGVGRGCFYIFLSFLRKGQNSTFTMRVSISLLAVVFGAALASPVAGPADPKKDGGKAMTMGIGMGKCGVGVLTDR